MKHLLLLPALLVLFLAHPLRAQERIVISVADLLPGYELDSVLVSDTAAAASHLNAQPQLYPELANRCADLRAKAQRALASLQNDYTHSDTLLWLDSNVVVRDFHVYAPRLRTFADFMGRMSIHYSRLEQQRLEAEKQAALQRALDEQRRQQDLRDQQADTLKQGIALHHRAILSACNGSGSTDKTKIKQLKDLYYSYLMVYNKYDLSSSSASPRTLAQLNELNDFQNDILENLLSVNSLPSQIENFKNVIKARCEKDNSDVLRSYQRVFKHTTITISFADLNEYHQYTARLRSVLGIQNRYLQAISLRDTINRNADQIQRLYSRHHRDVANAYKELHRTVSTLPAFNTEAQSEAFISGLEDFIGAQQIYIQSYDTLHTITLRSDTIVATAQSNLRDIGTAYRQHLPSLLPEPSFRTAAEGERYLQQLREAQELQRLYMQAIAWRLYIVRNDDTITSQRRADRVLWSGYSALRRQANLTPAFDTPQQGEQYIASLQSYVRMQRQFVTAQRQSRESADNASRITAKGNPHRNIAKAYQRVEKSIQPPAEIANTDDLKLYQRSLGELLALQRKVIALLESDVAADTDTALRGETDLARIRLAVGLN